MTITSQCFNCAWLYDGDPITCEAFAPNPIPENILTGEVSHTEPVPGQTNPDVLYLPLRED